MNAEQDQLLRLLLDHRGMLLAYVTAIVRDAELAEDVFQNVALIVLKKGELNKVQAHFPAWVRKVARLEALTALRKNSRTPQLLDQSVLELLEDDWRAGDGTRQGQMREALQGCLQKLSPRAQKLVEMRFVENLRGTELAERLGQPVNTVYVALSRIYRGLSLCIRRRLGAEGVAHG